MTINNNYADLINIRFDGNRELMSKAIPYTGVANPPLSDEQNLFNFFYNHLGKCFEMQLNITKIDVVLKTTNDTGSDFSCQICVLENNKVLFEYTTSGANHAGAIREAVREVMDILRKMKEKGTGHKYQSLKDIQEESEE
jgi:ribosome-associated translation inhibitor RaiA